MRAGYAPYIISQFLGFQLTKNNAIVHPVYTTTIVGFALNNVSL